MRYLSQRADWSKPMRDAPTAAISKPWRRHVLDTDGNVSEWDTSGWFQAGLGFAFSP